MPRICTVCSNPKRPEIDEALLRSAGYTAVARRFNLVDVSVRRHALHHLPKLISEIMQNYAIRQGIADTMRQASKPTESAERSMRVNESLVMRPIASAAEVLGEISAMAMVNPQDCFDEHGHLLPMRRLPEAAARACTGFEVDDAGALKKIRLEKVRALENLAKHYGLLTPDNCSQDNVQLNLSDTQIERLNTVLAYNNKPPIDVTPTKRDVVWEDAAKSEQVSSVRAIDHIVTNPPAIPLVEAQDERDKRRSSKRCSYPEGIVDAAAVLDVERSRRKSPKLRPTTKPKLAATPVSKPTPRGWYNWFNGLAHKLGLKYT